MVIISYIAAVLTTISFVPQAIKVLKTKDTSDISLIMYIMFTLGTLMWIIYGFCCKQYAVALANSITIIFSSIILTLKVINTLKKEDYCGQERK